MHLESMYTLEEQSLLRNTNGSVLCTDCSKAMLFDLTGQIMFQPYYFFFFRGEKNKCGGV